MKTTLMDFNQPISQFADKHAHVTLLYYVNKTNLLLSLSYSIEEYFN